MIRIVDHLKEKESVLQLNLARALRGARRGEEVIIYHPAGHIHGRLRGLQGVRYVELGGAVEKGPERGPEMGPEDKALLRRLTTLNPYRMPYGGGCKGEIFIHWFYRDRREDRLSACEIFHLNMLRYFNVMDRVTTIHVRCAARGGRTAAMAETIAILSEGKAAVDFNVVPQADSWEHDTIKEAVEYAVATGQFVYYTHFKGVTHIEDVNIIGAYRNGSRTIPGRTIAGMDVLYWCYIMYRYLFVDAPASYPAIGPLLHPCDATLHYKDASLGLFPKWAYKDAVHYTGSFQGMDGAFLRRHFERLGITKAMRDSDLWVGDRYTVEQVLSMLFRPAEVAHKAIVQKPYRLYSTGQIPEYQNDFRRLYHPGARNVCVANGTYKWIGGTDTFNWALCKALIDCGYTVYYYAPDMDGRGVTEKYLKELGVLPYSDDIPLAACFANQQSGAKFVGRCPVVQTCHSAIASSELPIRGAHALVSITEEIHGFLARKGYSTTLLRNGEDLSRYAPRIPLRTDSPRVLSICQGDDSALKRACSILGWPFHSVPKEVGGRVWHVEDLINQADIVVGIGRSLYDAMACGRVCISWDNRKYNPGSGCGYVTKDNWHDFARTNFTGRGFSKMDSVRHLLVELRKYNPADGADMRMMAEKELDMSKNAREYLRLAGLPPKV